MVKKIFLFLMISSVAFAATDEVSDTIKNIPGIYVKDQTGHIHTVDMRGFDAPNVLVLINGRRTNATDLSSVDWGQITTDRIEKIHVVKGPASVFYGDNSTGGAINIITKKGNARNNETRLSVFAGSHDYYTQSLFTSGTLYALNYRNKNEKGFRDNGEAKVQNYSIYVGDDNMNLEAGNYDASYGLPGAITREQMDIFGRDYTRLPNDSVKLDDHYVRLSNEWLSYSYRNREFAYSTDGFLSSSDSDYHQINMNRAITLDNHILTIGGLFQYNPTDIQTSFMDKSRIKKTDLGAFFQDTLLMDRWEISYGFRHDRAYYDFGQKRKHEIKNIHTGGIAYHFIPPDFSPEADTSKVYYSWGQGFRNPTTDEFFSFFEGLNEGVKSQASQIHEVGYMFDRKDIRIETIYFFITTEDEIYYDAFDFKNKNLPDTTRQGIEVAAEKKFGNMRLFGYYTFMDTDSGGGSIPQVPDHKFTIGSEYDLGKVDMFAQISYTGKRSLINDFSDSTKQKPYKTVDIGIKTDILGMNIVLGIDNLLDEKYEDIGILVNGTEYYYPNVDRTFYTKISKKF